MNDIDFINREKVIEYIIRNSYLNYILIVAPFGYGKSCLMKRVAKILQKDFYYIPIDMENYIKFEIVKKLNKLNKENKVYITIDNVHFDNKELVKDLIDKEISTREFNDLKVVLSSRNINIINKLKLERVRIIDVKMEAFSLDVIKEMIKRDGDYDNNFILKLSHHLLYHTGGYPKCLSEIFHKVNYTNIDNYFKNNSEIKMIIETNAHKIIDDLDYDIRKILPILSPIRKFNIKTLRDLINQGIIKYDIDNIFELEDKLIDSKIIERKDSLLQDDITRKLLAIHFRNSDKEKYLNVIQLTKKSYLNTIYHTNLPHLFAIELIFLELEEKLVEGSVGTKQEVETLFTLNTKLLMETCLSNTDKQLETRRLFMEQLEKDVELEAMVNYYVNQDNTNFKDVYHKIIGELNNE